MEEIKQKQGKTVGNAIYKCFDSNIKLDYVILGLEHNLVYSPALVLATGSAISRAKKQKINLKTEKKI